MKTGTARIVWGIVLTALLGLGTLRDLVVVPLTFVVAGPTAYAIGTAVGMLVVVALLAGAILLLRSGLAQRAAFHSVIRRPVAQVSAPDQGFQ